MESQAKRKNRVTARALRSALAFVALALGLARASQAGPQTLEIDASKFPQVTLTLRLPAEKITKDLTLKDITINEEGVAAEPSRYATTDSTALLLVIDRGPAMKPVIDEVRATAQRMLRALGKGPPAELLLAGDPSERPVAFTRSRGKLDAALDALAPAGGVRLAPALEMAVQDMSKVAARTRVVLVLTAGHDLDPRGAKLPPDPRMEKVIEQAKREGVSFRFICFGAEPDLARVTEISTRTGGAVLMEPTANEMSAIYGDAFPRVRFDLTYKSPRPGDFAMRKVAVAFRMFGFEGEVVGYYGDQGTGAPAGGTSAGSAPATPETTPEPEPETADTSAIESSTGQPRSLTVPEQAPMPSPESPAPP